MAYVGNAYPWKIERFEIKSEWIIQNIFSDRQSNFFEPFFVGYD